MTFIRILRSKEDKKIKAFKFMFVVHVNYTLGSRYVSNVFRMRLNALNFQFND